MADRSDSLVFFGATGDLAYKKIFPSLQSMILHGNLDMPVIGVAKAGWNLDKLKDRAKASLAEYGGGVNEEAFTKLCSRLRYVDGDYRDSSTYTQLRKEMGGAKRPIHYLAIPPSMFATVAEGLASSGCNQGARIILEKPFGRDLASAKELNATLHRFFDECAIFRIDHYLGKEPVQNIIYSRFANTLWEPTWNRNYMDHVEITMAESFGVEGRGKFYEEAGAIRDVIQNHMLQLVSILSMEPPSGYNSEAMRDERAKILRMIRPLSPEDVVRGQFRGYRQEAGVDPNSTVETFAVTRFWIDSWRWSGVPFYVRVGKKMPVTCTEIRLEYKHPPQVVYPDPNPGEPNYVRIRLSPEVIVAVGSRRKLPGEPMVGTNNEMIAQYHPKNEMEPYERLLMDAMKGESTYFARQDGVEEAWRIIDPILGNVVPVHIYEPGTWGPPQADELIAPHGNWSDTREEGIQT
ncbi:MAG TPA: glucose-6-phosphate dehydrogenase [Phycisphaerae bacterium]|nr:glucose-6-phosphate dehydrogenase [Phycisphaerae bacterium]